MPIYSYFVPNPEQVGDKHRSQCTYLGYHIFVSLNLIYVVGSYFSESLSQSGIFKNLLKDVFLTTIMKMNRFCILF